MHLILDIDGTLITDDEPIIFRPGLAKFLNFCFEHFETVSIWSAAGEDHVQSISAQVLPEGRKWLFVRHGKYCHARYSTGSGDEIFTPMITEKRLGNIWKSKQYREKGLKRENTIIIDNTPSVCTKNYGNAIYVRTFEGDPDDQELDRLMTYLQDFIKCENVRTVEKRNWRREIGKLNVKLS